MQAYTFSESISRQAIPRPLVKVCLAFLGGIVYAHYFPFNLTYSLIAIVLLLLAWIATIRRGSIAPQRDFHWRMVLVLAALLGAVRMQITFQHWQNIRAEVISLSDRGEQTIIGTVNEVHVYENSTTTIYLSEVLLEKWNRQRTFPGYLELLGSTDQLQTLQPGDRIQTSARISPIEGPSVPTGFDSQIYRLSQDIFASAFLNQETPIQSLDPVGWSKIRGWAYAAVNQIRHLLPQNPAAEEQIGLYASICFGLRSLMPIEIANALTRSGLAHLTSISGLHVTLILVTVAFILKRAGLKRRHAAWITAGFAILYVLMVGPRIPTLRAVIMTFVLLGSQLVERRIDTLNSLALAAIVLLMLYPGELFLPSFQLSFAAVWVLLLFAPLASSIQQYFRFQFLARLIQSILASLAIVIGLAPITITYFHIFSWGAILGNLLAIPLVALLLPLTYLWMISTLFPFPWLTIFLGDAATFLSKTLLDIIHYFAGPLFSIEVPSIPIPVGILLFLSVILLTRPTLILFEIQFIPVRAFQVALALLALAMWFPFLNAPWTPLRVDFLALGQGDCTVIQTPDHRVAIIDGGPIPRYANPDRSSRLLQFLQSQGIERIDVMILTHPQSDHIGSLSDVVKHIPVSVELEGCREGESENYRQFQSILEQSHVRRERIRRGDRIDLGSQTRLWILNPIDERLPEGLDINKKSVVAMVQYLDWNCLLTGDIDQDTENQLCDAFDHWNVEILKVPHHGSRFSSSEKFLAETRPQFAVIQVGRNPYGHPSSEARYRLYNIGAHVLRTDYDGTIRLQVWRDRLRLFTTRSNKLYLFNQDGYRTETG